MNLRWVRWTLTEGWYLEHRQDYGWSWPYAVELDLFSSRWVAKYREKSVLNPVTAGEFATLEEAKAYCEVLYRMGVNHE